MTSTPLQATITGATRLFAIIGDPIAQVKSPETFNPKIALAGREAALIPLHVRAEDFDEVIAPIMRIGNLDGLVLTMPFKERVLPHLAEISERARQVGAANAARRLANGAWSGDMFDGVGLVGAARSIGVDPRGLRVGLVGAGGAGSAIAFALAAAQASSLRIADLDAGRAERLAARVQAANPDCRTSAGALDIEAIDLLVNATPVGMRPGDGTPVNVDGLSASTSVIDIVTKPPVTPLLAAADKVGARHAGGAAMVAAQTNAILEFLGVPAA